MVSTFNNGVTNYQLRYHCVHHFNHVSAGNVKGVDSTAASSDALAYAKAIATANKCIVAVSGATDYVSVACTYSGDIHYICCDTVVHTD